MSFSPSRRGSYGATPFSGRFTDSAPQSGDGVELELRRFDQSAYADHSAYAGHSAYASHPAHNATTTEETEDGNDTNDAKPWYTAYKDVLANVQQTMQQLQQFAHHSDHQLHSLKEESLFRYIPAIFFAGLCWLLHSVAVFDVYTGSEKIRRLGFSACTDDTNASNDQCLASYRATNNAHACILPWFLFGFLFSTVLILAYAVYFRSDMQQTRETLAEALRHDMRIRISNGSYVLLTCMAVAWGSAAGAARNFEFAIDRLHVNGVDDDGLTLRSNYAVWIETAKIETQDGVALSKAAFALSLVWCVYVYAMKKWRERTGQEVPEELRADPSTTFSMV